MDNETYTQNFGNIFSFFDLFESMIAYGYEESALNVLYFLLKNTVMFYENDRIWNLINPYLDKYATAVLIYGLLPDVDRDEIRKRLYYTDKDIREAAAKVAIEHNMVCELLDAAIYTHYTGLIGRAKEAYEHERSGS